MSKNKTQVKMIEERKRNEANLREIGTAIDKRQQEIANLIEMKLRTMGAIEQLNELEKEK